MQITTHGDERMNTREVIFSCNTRRWRFVGVVALLIVTCGSPAASAVSFTALGGLPGSGGASFGASISANGSVVVGTSLRSTLGAEAFRWTAQGGMIGLGRPAGGNLSFP